MVGGHKGVKEARFDLVPMDALWMVARVFGKGAEKYAERNWERGLKWGSSKGALDRHLALFWAGQDNDEESGLPHLAHVAWHGLVLLAMYLRGDGEDDRSQFESGHTMVADVTNPEDIEAAQTEVRTVKVRAELIRLVEEASASAIINALVGSTADKEYLDGWGFVYNREGDVWVR